MIRAVISYSFGLCLIAWMAGKPGGGDTVFYFILFYFIRRVENLAVVRGSDVSYMV